MNSSLLEPKGPAAAIALIRGWLEAEGLDGLVIPSTDEFLSEFAPPPFRRLQWVTGFSGSTGESLILARTAALFLDGRYTAQGAEQAPASTVEITSSLPTARTRWIEAHVPAGARIALDPALHSVPNAEAWLETARTHGFSVSFLTFNPVDSLWTSGRPAEARPPFVNHPISYAGRSRAAKCASVSERCAAAAYAAFLIPDPEDVSWLLNVRQSACALGTGIGDWPVVPSCRSHVLVLSDGQLIWFAEKGVVGIDVQSADQDVVVRPIAELGSVLRELAAAGPIGCDLKRTPYRMALYTGDRSMLVQDDFVARSRWRKTDAEVQQARQAHVQDAAAVTTLMARIKTSSSLEGFTELSTSAMLEDLRRTSRSYLGPSMPMMSAVGSNGARPHHVPTTQTDRSLAEHPIYWMDSGGHFGGGTTDNTFALAVGVPGRDHVVAHTAVLKGIIALSETEFPVGTQAFQLDCIARLALWRQGLNYAHGTGHGVGSYANIHEGPVISRDPGAYSAVELEPNMIISNEPAFYKPGEFGVRVETHMVVEASAHSNFLKFDTISRLPIDPDLIDFELLDRRERRWLSDYHQAVLTDLSPLLDVAGLHWLEAICKRFNTERLDGEDE